MNNKSKRKVKPNDEKVKKVKARENKITARKKHNLTKFSKMLILVVKTIIHKKSLGVYSVQLTNPFPFFVS